MRQLSFGGIHLDQNLRRTSLTGDPQNAPRASPEDDGVIGPPAGAVWDNDVAQGHWCTAADGNFFLAG